ncbi:hypothetical protein OCV73_02575 [Barnesiella propionica]|uniref:hypothetical protein n=1 Tax=Barnesiella propionica TaxID=2981781 RepID=UPI0011C78105|nr:hypothetical protein [Barnesiella propionica]MCU6767843.1 hypothetical protein [Barnesiella propionica]
MATKDDILNNSGIGSGKTNMQLNADRVATPEPQQQRDLLTNNNRTATEAISPPPIPTLKQPAQNLSQVPERLSYAEIFQRMHPYHSPTPEELEKEKKKKKREAIFSAIGDGISALSNLYFTTQYAPNTYDPKNSLSAKSRERWDKLNKEREHNQRQYMEEYLRAVAMDESNKKDERNWRHKLEREGIEDERYNINEKRNKEMENLNERLKQHQITSAKYKAEQERIAAKYAEDYEMSKIGKNKASSSASQARANYYNNGGGSGGKKPTLRIGSKIHTYDTNQDYERAIQGYAKEYGIPLYTVVKTTGKYGREQTSTPHRKPLNQLAAEVEDKATQINEKESYRIQPKGATPRTEQKLTTIPPLN